MYTGTCSKCICLCDFCVRAHREDFALEKVEQENQARALLEQTINMLQSIAQQNANVVDKMKLMQMSRNMVNSFLVSSDIKISEDCVQLNT